MKIKVTLNTLLAIIGLLGVWFTTHNWWAMFWTVVAAAHISFKGGKKD
jgi:hypothetical protein